MKNIIPFLVFIFFTAQGFGQLASCPDNLTRTCSGTGTQVGWTPGATCGDLPITIVYSEDSPAFSSTLNKQTFPICNSLSVVYNNTADGICDDALGFNLDFSSNGGPVCNYSSGGVPVTLSYFQSKVNKNTISLLWRTEAELENAGFEIQRSLNSRDWETISFIEGAGNSIEAIDYNYEDKTPFAGMQYYRLNQVDFDGKSSYSKILTVEFTSSSTIVNVYPNPAKDMIFIQTETAGINRATIFDNMGREVLEVVLNEEGIDISPLDAGIYFVQITNGNLVEKVRFVKE